MCVTSWERRERDRGTCHQELEGVDERGGYINKWTYRELLERLGASGTIDVNKTRRLQIKCVVPRVMAEFAELTVATRACAPVYIVGGGDRGEIRGRKCERKVQGRDTGRTQGPIRF